MEALELMALKHPDFARIRDLELPGPRKARYLELLHSSGPQPAASPAD